MASTDDRIVAMQFDNKAFEERVASTISSLDKLQKSISSMDAKKGFEDLSRAASGFNLDGISHAVEDIGSKFSAMGVIAFSVLNNIASRAVDAGISLAKSLSLDQVLSGFQEYETNLNSIQTVLANTRRDGTTLDDVNAALNQLNEYSDKTIYNFGQMARNIGTFTAAGVDLDTSVASIKGIANLAATSGSTAEQAATAMYQLSQAISTGTVRLMDWNSVVNAGMGGEVFQRALFETGKSLKAIPGVPIGQTFEEWTSHGNSFRSSLESGWLTSKVLTTTLQGFTGDLTEAQLTSLGYTKEQAAEFMEIGKTAQDAATKVKTISQLISTIKESIGSGWSTSFRLVVGDFEEARGILTLFSETLNGIAAKSADARNALLQGWHDLGGRNLLIESIVNTFRALAKIINTVKSAFHDVFPPLTAQRLFDLTKSLRDFTERLDLGQEKLSQIRHIFVGFFSALSIGWEVIKEGIGFFKGLFDGIQIFDQSNGGALGFFSDLADKVNRLNQTLVEGGGIKQFFEDLPATFSKFIGELNFDNVITKIRELFTQIKAEIVGIFTGEGGAAGGDNPILPSAFADSVSGIIDRLKERFGFLEGIITAIGDFFDWLKGKTVIITTALGDFATFLKEQFAGVPQAVADILAQTDYNQALDTLNVGLFGGFLLLFKNFSTTLGNFGGVFGDLKKALSEMTGVLQAMQTKLKAEALLDIAKALGVLTASILVLSLIDSAALSKSMGALAVGMIELVGAMTALNTIISSPTDAAKLGVLATGLTLLAGALLILAVASKLMATMDWEELAKGLTGVAGLLVAIVAAMQLMPDDAKMIRTGLGVIGLAIGMNLLAGAMKIFATMNWEEMGKGLTGVAGGLVSIVLAMNLMPDKVKLIGIGFGIVEIAFAMNLLAGSMKIFATMNWEEMGKGMASIGAALVVIAGAMQIMPSGLILQGAGLLAIGVGLTQIAIAMKSMGGMDWIQIARGLAGMAGALGVLALAGYAMEGAIPGAIAIGIMALSLGKIADVIKSFSGIKWGELLGGVGKLAVVMAALALGSLAMGPAIPVMLGVGAALVLLGAGIALFGLGANLLASAFAIIATAGTQGVAVLLEALDGLIERLPDIIKALADGFIGLAQQILAALPGLISKLGAIIGALLRVIIDNIPKFAEALLTMIHSGLQVVRDAVPDFVATGFAVLIAFLTGIRDNIGEITKLVGEIIINFLRALALEVPGIIDAVYDLIIVIIKGVIAKLVDIANYLIPKGLELLEGLWNGVKEKAKEVAAWFTDLPGEVVGWIGAVLGTLLQKGKDLIQGLWNGASNILSSFTTWVKNIPGLVVDWIGDVAKRLMAQGRDLIQGLWDGVKEIWESVKGWFTGLPANVGEFFSDAVNWLFDAGKKIIQGLWNGMKNVWNEVTGWLGSIAGWTVGLKGPPAKDAVLLVENGMLIMQGLHEGMKTGWNTTTKWLKSLDPADHMTALDDKFTSGINSAITSAAKAFSQMDEFTPTITPVLDLSNLKNGATAINSALGLGTSESALALAMQVQNGSVSSEDQAQKQTILQFEQNNYSPEALSTADIYRRTRNQVSMAKIQLGLVPA